jgi:hypothetical protein
MPHTNKSAIPVSAGPHRSDVRSLFGAPKSDKHVDMPLIPLSEIEYCPKDDTSRKTDSKQLKLPPKYRKPTKTRSNKRAELLIDQHPVSAEDLYFFSEAAQIESCAPKSILRSSSCMYTKATSTVNFLLNSDRLYHPSFDLRKIYHRFLITNDLALNPCDFTKYEYSFLSLQRKLPYSLFSICDPFDYSLLSAPTIQPLLLQDVFHSSHYQSFEFHANDYNLYLDLFYYHGYFSTAYIDDFQFFDDDPPDCFVEYDVFSDSEFSDEDVFEYYNEHPPDFMPDFLFHKLLAKSDESFSDDLPLLEEEVSEVSDDSYSLNTIDEHFSSHYVDFNSPQPVYSPYKCFLCQQQVDGNHVVRIQPFFVSPYFDVCPMSTGKPWYDITKYNSVTGANAPYIFSAHPPLPTHDNTSLSICTCCGITFGHNVIHMKRFVPPNLRSPTHIYQVCTGNYVTSPTDFFFPLVQRLGNLINTSLGSASISLLFFLVGIIRHHSITDCLLSFTHLIHDFNLLFDLGTLDSLLLLYPYLYIKFTRVLLLKRMIVLKCLICLLKILIQLWLLFPTQTYLLLWKVKYLQILV